MLTLPVAVLILLRGAPSLDASFFDAEVHLWVVSVIAGFSAAIALVAAFGASESKHPGLVHLSIGASAVGVFMLGHGLTTPGVLGNGPNAWVGRFPYLALGIFTITLFSSSRRVDKPLERLVARRPVTFVAGAFSLMAAFTAFIVANPSLWPRPAWEENALDVVSVGIILMAHGAIWVHWRRWLLGNDAVQLALTFAAAMTIAAQVSLEHGVFGRLSWWDYHAYLLAGFGCTVYAIVSRSVKSRRVSGVLANAFSDDVFAHIVDGYPDALRQLVKAVEVRDAYTHGHSQRTAHVATELGIRLGLAEDRLRVVARGAFLHDLGKIGIPDAVLNKPSKLTAEERALIETHPRLGFEMAQGAGSLKESLDVILHHHEKFDGTGYPDGLRGSQIPLEARVVAVADVWDALTTDRAYRKGWEPSRALSHIAAGSGTHFDPVVVNAMVDLAAEWGIGLSRDAGEADVGWDAAELCHQSKPDQELVGV